MFRVMLRMRIRPGAGAQFEEIIGDIACAVAARAGNLGQQVYREASDPLVYYVFSDWVDDKAFWVHESSAEHRSRIARMGPVRVESSMSTMQLVNDLGEGISRRRGAGSRGGSP
jgi:heme oxygenase (mycobilin-producing)